MTSVSTPVEPESVKSTTGQPAPRVLVAVTLVEGSDVAPVLDALDDQVYEVSDIVLIGDGQVPLDRDLQTSSSLAEVLRFAGPEIDLVWLLHGDARPRRDALSALVSEMQRQDAAVVGSKLLLEGSIDTLEGVGATTDVFGELYSGLDAGEVDLEQYDVVRDVGFVSSVSILVRRDLARGLGGFDETLPPMAAGLDFSQRARLAGARVMVVPSSEVFHTGLCRESGRGWREEAGRIRAMLVSYRPVTLIWMVPLAWLVALADGLGSLIFGRWRTGGRHVAAWGWNIVRFPSTVGRRRELNRIRQESDEELFRYQVEGSVALRDLSAEVSDWILDVFDDTGTGVAGRVRSMWNPAATGMFLAILVSLMGLWSIFLGGFPVIGWLAPFNDGAVAQLSRVAGGWDRSGFGGDGALHPLIGLVSWGQAVLFGSPGLAQIVITMLAVIAAIAGTGRLARRIGITGSQRYVVGVLTVAAPSLLVATGMGRWQVILAAAALPWALAAVLGERQGTGTAAALGRGAEAVVAMGILSLIIPVAVVIPLLVAVLVRISGGAGRPLDALVGLIGGVATIPHLLSYPGDILGDPTLGVGIAWWWVAGLGLASIVAVLLADNPGRALALGSGAMLGPLSLALPVGAEVQMAMLVLSALAAALVAGALIRGGRVRPRFRVILVGVGVALLVGAVPGLIGGRLGLPSDVWGDRLEFLSNMDPTGVSRVLLVSQDPDILPGDKRSGPGFFYRVIETPEVNYDELWLSEPGEGDTLLEDFLDLMATGAILRPGAELADFGIEWVVTVRNPEDTTAPLEVPLETQVDLIRIPMEDETVQVFRNANPASVATRDWFFDGTGYSGPEVERLRLAANANSSWTPDYQEQAWAMSLSGVEGAIRYEVEWSIRILVWLGWLVIASGVVLRGVFRDQVMGRKPE